MPNPREDVQEIIRRAMLDTYAGQTRLAGLLAVGEDIRFGAGAETATDRLAHANYFSGWNHPETSTARWFREHQWLPGQDHPTPTTETPQEPTHEAETADEDPFRVPASAERRIAALELAAQQLGEQIGNAHNDARNTRDQHTTLSEQCRLDRDAISRAAANLQSTTERVDDHDDRHDQHHDGLALAHASIRDLDARLTEEIAARLEQGSTLADARGELDELRARLSFAEEHAQAFRISADEATPYDDPDQRLGGHDNPNPTPAHGSDDDDQAHA